MIKECTVCGKQFEDGEERDRFGRFVKAGKSICSLLCENTREREWAKKRREKIWFGGLRDKALARDKFSCRTCHKKENLVVHHIDGNGRRSSNPNNTLENLITLCLGCHSRLHCTTKTTRENIEKVKELWDLSDREIARRIGCTHPTIAIMRKKIISLSEE